MQAPVPARDRLTEGLRRWRALFGAACLLIGVLAIAGFLIEQHASDEVLHTGTVMRETAAAQRSAWDVEASMRRYTLTGDSAALAAGEGARIALRRHIAALHGYTADHAEQVSALARIESAVQLWDSAYVAEYFRTKTSTVAQAMERTSAFDEVSSAFDAFSAEESEMRMERIDQQRLIRRVSLATVLLALIVSAIAFSYLGRENEDAAVEAQTQRRRAEDQANELEAQARQLTEQAATLEEQAAELEHRLERGEVTTRLLEQTASFLDSAVEGAPFGIAFFDRQLRFQRVNGALARMNGVPAAAHIGRTIEDIVPQLAASLRPVLERVITTGRMEPEVLLEAPAPNRPLGTRRYLVTYYPIAAKGRDPVGVGAMIQDVTERSRLEDQLRQAQKMEAVGRLAGGIAHDFNNILTIIQSYGEILAQDLPAGSSSREEVEAIQGAADRATALARQLLAFSRRDVIIPRDLDVSESVRGMNPILERLLKQGISLEIALHDGPLIAHIDPGQLEQVLMNLCINAVDAMPQGGVLRITTARDEPPTGDEGPSGPGNAILTVSDTGTGMTREVQDRLFEPFFTTKPAGEGTGLGLATTYAIVRDAGGVIRVESTIGHGSRFEVHLPLAGTHRLDHPAHKQSPSRGTPIARSGEVILLAEDEDAIRSALARVLRGNGYRVIEAADGASALAMAGAEAGAIHLLLTDVMMPGIGGKELVQRLRADRPDTRVILMSGYTDDDVLRAELGDARFVFLQKPFATRLVLRSVRDLLDAD